MKLKDMIVVGALFVNFGISQEVLGMTQEKGKVWYFVKLLSSHRHRCGKPPLKQYWYKFGQFRSACDRFDAEKLNDLAKDFEHVEIKNKNIYILNLNKHFDMYIMHHAIFYANGANVWRTYGGFKDIQYFCERNDATLCKSFKLNKVRFHKSKNN